MPPHSHAKPGPQDGVHDPVVAALATREAEIARRRARARQRLGTGAIGNGWSEEWGIEGCVSTSSAEFS